MHSHALGVASHVPHAVKHTMHCVALAMIVACNHKQEQRHACTQHAVSNALRVAASCYTIV